MHLDPVILYTRWNKQHHFFFFFFSRVSLEMLVLLDLLEPTVIR